MKRVLFFFLSMLLLQPVSSRSPQEKPRLLVGIMVDGFQPDHIERLSDRLSDAGLKKLVSQGVVFTRLSSGLIAAGNAPDITTLLTGSVPYYHGVAANRIYNRYNASVESVFKDKSYSGIASDLKLSARAMKSSTLIDELMMSNAGKSKSYVIGINAEDAIALGGHAANGVVWIDDMFLRWSSTDYYSGGMPWQALDMNSKGGFMRNAEREWRPLYAPNTYVAALDMKNPKAFVYKGTDKKSAKSTVSVLKNTPSANSLVAELGLRVFQEENLGADNNTDAIMLQFTVRTPGDRNFSRISMEKEDMYMRLDAEIQFLIQKIISKTGEDHVLFFLFGNRMYTHSPEELKQYNFHAGYFNAGRSMALLNSYLMALYGQENWIEGYYGKNIFLNKKKIAEHNIDFGEMEDLVIDFMMEFEGIQSAYSFDKLKNGASGEDSELTRIRNSSYKSSVGDVILTLMPGWLETDDSGNPVGESNDLVSYFPFYLYGGKTEQQIISSPCRVIDIAATLAEILRIPYPNANMGMPLDILKYKE